MKTRLSYPTTEYLIDLALKAGCITRKNFSLGMKREWKSDETPLTVADTAINDLVVESINRDFPEVRVIGEEGSNTIEDAEYTVFCDPVDGTIPFSLGLPVSTFCISVFERGKPIIGVIYDPFQNRIWHAERGKRAYLSNLDGQGSHPVNVSKLTTVNRSNICMIWWKDSSYHLHDVCKLLMDAGGHWMNPASLAIFGGLIASGTFDGSIFPGKNAWETGAMQVIVEEAGGKVTDIHGKEMQYGPRGQIEGHIIANGLIHDKLVDLVSRRQGVP